MRVVTAALLLLVASWSPALAKLKFCNNFKYAIHIAIAYETSSGWVSDGWTGVKPDSCYDSPDYSELTSFFYHAETDAIKTDEFAVRQLHAIRHNITSASFDFPT